MWEWIEGKPKCTNVLYSWRGGNKAKRCGWKKFLNGLIKKSIKLGRERSHKDMNGV